MLFVYVQAACPAHDNKPCLCPGQYIAQVCKRRSVFRQILFRPCAESVHYDIEACKIALGKIKDILLYELFYSAFVFTAGKSRYVKTGRRAFDDNQFSDFSV